MNSETPRRPRHGEHPRRDQRGQGTAAQAKAVSLGASVPMAMGRKPLVCPSAAHVLLPHPRSACHSCSVSG